MDKRESVLRKIQRIANASFKNAVRLHEDAVLLFNRGSIPSALLMSALSMEEIGKYFMFESVWWHNRIDGIWLIEDMQSFFVVTTRIRQNRAGLQFMLTTHSYQSS